MQITVNDLLKVQRADPKVLQDWVLAINLGFRDYGFNSKREAAAFLATLIHESSCFTRLVESTNYSAQGLARTWPNRFSSTGRAGGAPNALANRLHRQPVAIANHVYANRMGNGSPESGDGYRFRGHGPIQNTGRAAALWLNRTIGRRYGVDFVQNYSLLTTPKFGTLAAFQYWEDNVRPQLRRHTTNATNNKRYMDVCSDLVNRGRVTTAIGDAIGFADRYNKFAKLLTVLTETGAAKHDLFTNPLPIISEPVDSIDDGLIRPKATNVTGKTSWGQGGFFETEPIDLNNPLFDPE